MNVDLIIPFHGQTDLLIQCLRGIEAGPAIAGRVFLVDDMSPREEADRAQRDISALSLPIEWISLRQRSGFVGAINVAWPRTRQPVVLILNNDTIPTSDLLPRLLSVLERCGSIAAVAPASDNPRDLFQYRDPMPQDAGAPRREVFWEFSLVSYLTAMCLAIRRAAIQGVLFDPVYSPGYFEDLDLCCRLRLRGWQLAVLEHCRLRHLGNATFGKEPGLLHLLGRNYATFSQRWSHLPEHRQLDRLLRSLAR